MKREEIDSILKNADLDDGGKIDAILNLRGAEVNAANKRYSDLEGKYNDAVAAGESHKDYDAIKAEVETLRAEKADRAMSDRFTAVVGGKKFVNTFTADGVKKAFSDALALPENEGKTDEEIYASISDGKEAEWYESPVRVRMTPAAGKVDAPNQREAYLDEKYANNPFYKK